MSKHIFEYPLSEIDTMLNHGPIHARDEERSLYFTLRKHPNRLNPQQNIYELHINSEQVSTTQWGASLDEVLLRLIFGLGVIVPNVIDAEPPKTHTTVINTKVYAGDSILDGFDLQFSLDTGEQAEPNILRIGEGKS